MNFRKRDSDNTKVTEEKKEPFKNSKMVQEVND